MRIIWVFIFFVFRASISTAQEVRYTQPERLPSSINSSYEEISPLMTSNGKTLYFVRMFDPQNKGGKTAGMDVWISLKDHAGNWLNANNKTKWNNKLNNAVVGIRDDGKTVYLLNSYTNKSGIGFSRNINGEWTTPEVILMPGIEKLNFVGFYMNPTFNILLMSMVKEDSFGKEDLYVSLRDSLDQWSEPLNLGSTINTDGFETAPFLSADGTKLYFTSNGHKGFGDADIFVSERLYGKWTVWSRPKNLGNQINSEKFDSYFSIYDSICFFSSNRSSRYSDIYMSRIEKNNKIQLKDSVNRIIDETRRLLDELKNLPVSVEHISFAPNTFLLTNALKGQIKKWIRSYDLNLINEIELLNTKAPMDFEQVNEVTDYLISLGVDQTKIKNITNLGAKPKLPATMELRIYLKSKE
jgi:WD40-like Beta Propeller Repeat